MDKKIQAVAKAVGIQDWKDLKACILFESNGNPKAVNPYSKATGLIQFMPACVTLSTRALTIDGWKYCDELQLGDLLLSYNLGKDILEWNRLQAVNIFDFPGSLIRMQNKSFDFTVTANHKWVVDDYSGRRSLKETTALNSKCVNKIIRVAPYDAPPSSGYTNELVTLIGFIFADGSIGKNGNQIDLYQKEYPDIFRAALTAVGISFTEVARPDGVIRFSFYGDNARTISNILLINGEKRLPPKFLFTLSREQLEILWDALLLTDGWVSCKGWEGFSQSNKARAEDIQLLTYLRGFLSDLHMVRPEGVVNILGRTCKQKPKWQATVRRRKCSSASSYRMQYSWVSEEPVWCPTLENKTWVANNNGHISITGNTAAALGTSTEQLSKMSAERQLDYVEKYFLPWRGKLKTLEDIYMAILWPRAVGKPSSYVLFEKADVKYPKRYLQNKGLDWNKDGFITKAEATAKVRKIRETL